MARRRARIATAAALMTLAAAPAADARDVTVTSFDGTPINTHFFPAAGLKSGEKAPTLMMGPGWGGAGETNPSAGEMGRFIKAGYNMVTWDPRGFHGSGGEVNIDSPHFEARDAQAIIDYISKQPEAQLESAGDPLLGMTGGSYGGGIQYITAAADKRVDVIAPNIAWNQLTRALLGAFDGPASIGPPKTGWALLLTVAGVPTSTIPGIFAPSGVQTGSLAQPVISAVTSGLATGTVSAADRAWFIDHGPDRLLKDVKVPTLISQGTIDTLFTLEEASRNYEGIKRNGVPIKMLWFCGGHGTCRTPANEDRDRPFARKLAWFDRHLRGNVAAKTGPAFEWIDEAGAWHGSRAYPLKDAGTADGRGSGNVTLLPGESATSGRGIYATPDPLALKVPITGAPAGTEIVGSPKLKATYRATGAGTLPDRRTYVYGQIVDIARDIVVGNHATPIPITLDSQAHTVQLDLERIGSRATASGYRLEISPQSNLYDIQRAAGSISFSDVQVTLPKTEPVTQPELKLTRRCLKGGKLRVSVTGQTDIVSDVSFKFAKKRVARDTAAAFQRTLSRKTVRKAGKKSLRAVVTLSDGLSPERVTLTRKRPSCRK